MLITYYSIFPILRFPAIKSLLTTSIPIFSCISVSKLTCGSFSLSYFKTLKLKFRDKIINKILLIRINFIQHFCPVPSPKVDNRINNQAPNRKNVKVEIMNHFDSESIRYSNSSVPSRRNQRRSRSTELSINNKISIAHQKYDFSPRSIVDEALNEY